MRLGVVLAVMKIGTYPVVIRDYGQAIEAMGYDHIMVFDLVLGANSATHKLLWM